MYQMQAHTIYESSRAMSTMSRTGQFGVRDQAKLMSESYERKQNVEGGEKACDQFVCACLARETLVECVVDVLWANGLPSKLPNGAKAEGPQPANQRVDAGRATLELFCTTQRLVCMDNAANVNVTQKPPPNTPPNERMFRGGKRATHLSRDDDEYAKH
jgi:hypothetical protein